MVESIKCRAAILYEEGERLEIENVIVPAPGENQVRVKMVAAGICASDAHYVWGQQKLKDMMCNLPTIMGHEGAGIIESVGPNVTDLKPGDHVLTTFVGNCRNCRLCKIEDQNNCENYSLATANNLTIKLEKNDTIVYCACGIGCYSEFITISLAHIVKIKQTDKLSKLCVISCAVATGFFSAVNLGNVRAGSTCAVWGIGGIGLNVLQGCKYNNAKNILAIDINPDKREMALKFGATEFICPKNLDKPLEQFLLEKYGGIDCGFDCFGSQIIIDQALNSLGIGGKFVMVGVAPPDVLIKYPALMLIFGHTITGSLLGGKKGYEAYPKLIDLYLNNEIKIDEMITNHFKLEQINEAFETLKDGKCIRSLIIFDG